MELMLQMYFKHKFLSFFVYNMMSINVSNEKLIINVTEIHYVFILPIIHSSITSGKEYTLCKST